MKNSTQKRLVEAIFKTIKGTAFVGVRGYENAKGEVSDQTILAGASYEKMLEHDFAMLKLKKDEVFSILLENHSLEVISLAYSKVFESLDKRLSSPEMKEKLRLENDPTIKQSDAQSDAFISLGKGVKLHIESNQIHIFGVSVRKKVIVPIEYKEVKSAELTIVQNKIKKLCNFKQNKIVSFIFDKAELKVQGLTL